MRKRKVTGLLIIGTFWKTRKIALAYKKDRERLTKNPFEVLRFPKGYLVVSKRQLS